MPLQFSEAATKKLKAIVSRYPNSQAACLPALHLAQAEFGLLCPVNVTDSTSRMLRHYASDALKAAYLDRLTTPDFDALWQGTQWMTERTGGSDVGACTTVARRDADGTWRLWGDKWFCSNASADVALTLARPESAHAGTRGLAMFLVPRRLPDGARNAWTINRLKDKLGSRSMATGEVTYAGAVAYLVGDPGRGFAQMIEMVNVSRLSNALRTNLTKAYLEDFELSLPEWRLLALVARFSPLRFSEVTARSGMDKGQVSRTLRVVRLSNSSQM